MVNLVVDEMSEQAEDSGGVIRVNANFDEQNRKADGNPLADYQPDHMEGHRITPDDPNLKHGSFSVDASGKGRWRLVFPENIKAWKEEEGGGHTEVISSRFSGKVETPFSCRLKIEGIKGSRTANDVRITGEFLPEGSREGYEDSVFLTVIETRFVLTFDDGPLPEKTEKIARALKNFYHEGEPVRAAFFQPRAKIRRLPDLTRFVHQKGHLIFNRAISLERRSRARITAEEIEENVLQWEEEIYKTIGRKPERVIRARYLKKGDPFEKELEKIGVRVCGGELTFDFRAPSVEVVKTKAEELLEGWNTRENPRLHVCPAILIFHDFPEHTYEHIGEIVSYLQDRGFMLVNFDLKLAY